MAGGEVSRFWRSVLASGESRWVARSTTCRSKPRGWLGLVRDAAAMGVRWETLARSNLVSGLAEARRPIAGELVLRSRMQKDIWRWNSDASD